MKILIGGDLVPTSKNNRLFEAADVESLVGKELKQILDEADYRIFNLEVPLTDTRTPIDKFGPNFMAPTATAKGIKAMGANLLTLANNHIMDQGAEGLHSTIAALEANGVACVGVGDDLAEAAKPFVFTVEDKKIGIYACAEHEFSIVSADKPGANPIDLLESPDHVSQLRENCDYLIVLYHGGKEHFRYPSPDLQKVCRKLIDKGADLVICQHSHCVGCEEKYNGGTIVYGQGNFLFEKDSSEFWKTGLLLEIGDDYELGYIPIVKTGSTIKLADEKQKEEILSAYFKRSQEIKEPGFVENNYHTYARQMLGYYLLELSGREFWIFAFRVLDKLCGHRLRDKLSFRKKYNRRHHMVVKNFVECEVHRELLINALSEPEIQE